jgi:hypothetical protein
VSNSILIVEELISHGLLANSEPISDPIDPSRYFVFLRVDFDERGRQSPSRNTIETAVAALKERGLVVEALLIDTRTLDIESGVRASLLHSHPDAVRNVFLSITKKGVSVWIDAKRSLDDGLRKSIAERLSVFLGQFDLVVDSLATLGEGNTPGKLALLNAIRLGAPATLESLTARLQSSGFVVPSVDWLKRRLDVHRRAGDVVRLHDGSFALNAATIRALGTSQRGRSPDISRLLALARGKM